MATRKYRRRYNRRSKKYQKKRKYKRRITNKRKKAGMFRKKTHFATKEERTSNPGFRETQKQIQDIRKNSRAIGNRPDLQRARKAADNAERAVAMNYLLTLEQQAKAKYYEEKVLKQVEQFLKKAKDNEHMRRLRQEYNKIVDEIKKDKERQLDDNLIDEFDSSPQSTDPNPLASLTQPIPAHLQSHQQPTSNNPLASLMEPIPAHLQTRR